MEERTKNILGMAVLVLVAGIAGAFLLSDNGIFNGAPQNAEQAVSQNQNKEASPLIIQGSVTSVNPEKLEITVVSGDVEKTVKINPATRIEKIISQKNESGKVEKTLKQEINLKDLQKGQEVIVSYQSEKNNVLYGVSVVSFTANESVEEYLKRRPPPPSDSDSALYVRGKVVSIDAQDNKIVYKPYIIETVSNETASMSFSEDILVYRVNEMRVTIDHAKVEATLGDVKPGQVLFIRVENKSARDGKFVPREFVITSWK